jgi:hypothetical protein
MPVFNSSPPQITDLVMKNLTEVRSLVSQVTDIQSDVSTAQEEISLLGTVSSRLDTIASAIDSDMVRSSNYTVQSSAFIQDGPLWKGVVSHGMIASTVVMTLLDTDKDEQSLIQKTVNDDGTITLEMTNAQYEDCEFPLLLTVQGLPRPLGASTTFRKATGMSRYWRVLNGELQNSIGGIDADNASFASGVSQLKLAEPNLIYIQNANGFYRLADDDLAAGFIFIAQSEFDAATDIG